MINRATLFAAPFSLLVSAVLANDPKPAVEQPKANALDIIPEDVFVAIAIRNASELTKRGDEFIDKTGLRVPMRLTKAYGFVVDFLGIRDGLDKNGAAALMLFRPDVKEDAVVLAVPVDDLKVMASNFGMSRERLLEGEVIDRRTIRDNRTQPPSFVRYVAVRGNHVLLGGDPKIVELAAKGQTLGKSLPIDERETLAQDDILLYGNAKSARDEWGQQQVGLEKQLDDFPPDEAKALRQVVAATNELSYIAIGASLDMGLGATVVLRFQGRRSRDILTRLEGERTGTSLTGLPAGQVLAAHASSGDGDTSAAIARALLRFLLKTFSIKTDEFISAGHRSNVVGVFGEGWQRLNGSRTALYENETPERDGLYSLIAVLDTDDAKQFVTDMTGLARFINASGLSPDDFGETIDTKTIHKLIAELGHDEYRVRQMATTKLGLVGESALPALEKAVKFKDIEVRFRARALLQQINESLAAEREDLLRGDLLSRIRPNFAYFPEQETRSGRPVDIVRMQLQVDEAPFAARLRRLLGPEWNELRLTTVGNRVVVLLGSNKGLFEKAITDTRAGKAGIHGESRHACFRNRAHPERIVEFHFSLARARQLLAQGADVVTPADEPTSTTSFGLAIAPQRVRFDIFAPFEEAKAVINSMGW